MFIFFRDLEQDSQEYGHTSDVLRLGVPLVKNDSLIRGVQTKI